MDEEVRSVETCCLVKEGCEDIASTTCHSYAFLSVAIWLKYEHHYYHLAQLTRATLHYFYAVLWRS